MMQEKGKKNIASVVTLQFVVCEQPSSLCLMLSHCCLIENLTKEKSYVKQAFFHTPVED